MSSLSSSSSSLSCHRSVRVFALPQRVVQVSFSSSRVAPPVDPKVLHDLESMQDAHDYKLVMTVLQLEWLRSRYSILTSIRCP